MQSGNGQATVAVAAAAVVAAAAACYKMLIRAAKNALKIELFNNN